MTRFGIGAEPSAPLRVATRVALIGSHPHAGRTGTVVHIETTPFGARPVIRMDGGGECFVVNPAEMRVIG
jgi:ribosomal protein S4E